MLVSICLTCYNQEKYIEQCVESIFAQTYRPLEIVICDDCSSDHTVSVIRKVMNRHEGDLNPCKVELRVNKVNLGIVRNYDQCFRMAHGVLRFTAAGDDWYHAEKVKRIVDAWRLDGSRATVFHAGFIEVDENGRPIKCMPPRSARMALGGTGGYSHRVFDEFSSFDHQLDVEDQVLAKRALMIGPELRLDDALTYYRVGTGLSTKFNSHRECRIKSALSMFMSVDQLRQDIAAAKGRLDDNRVRLVGAMVEELYSIDKAIYDFFTGETFGQRRSAQARLWTLCGRPVNIRSRLVQYAYLLPTRCGDAMANLLNKYFKFLDHSRVFARLKKMYRWVRKSGEYSRRK